VLLVRARAQVGPFSHLRPESDIGEEAHIGNFVETKKTRLDKGAKANHLAYLGDGFVGEGANVGAGTIFCNYDGFEKHVTRIGKGAFIGSDSQLVAPVTVGDGAYVGTGTTVTRDVPADALAIGRARQENKEGYDAAAVMTYVNNLKGRLLLYYGTADNNVHQDNSMQLIQALQRAGKSFEVQVGPDQPHSGVNNQRMMEFFIENLVMHPDRIFGS